MQKKLIIPVLAALGLLMAMPEDASAQYFRRPTARYGFRHRPHTYLGANLYGFARAHDTGDRDMRFLGAGGGGGVTLGGRLSPWISVEGTLSFGYHNEEYDDGSRSLDALWMMLLTADAKVHIPTRGPIEPYFQAGLGFSYVGAVWPDGYGDTYDDAFASGPVINLGGGVDLWLGPNLSVGARLLYRGIYFASESNAGSQKIPRSYVSGLTLDFNGAIHF